MFYSWLMYRLATLFSMAVLSFMISMVLDLTIRVAGALWMGNVPSTTCAACSPNDAKGSSKSTARPVKIR